MSIGSRLRSVCICSVLAFFFVQCSAAQQPGATKPLKLIKWYGPGAITLPSGGDWKPEALTVYDKGGRPVAQFTKGANLSASFILFENLSGKRYRTGMPVKDVITPIVKEQFQPRFQARRC